MPIKWESVLSSLSDRTSFLPARLPSRIWRPASRLPCLSTKSWTPSVNGFRKPYWCDKIHPPYGGHSSMAERYTVDVDVVGSPPIAHPNRHLARGVFI